MSEDENLVCGYCMPPFLLGDVRLWMNPTSMKLWVCPANVPSDLETYPHMELSEVLAMEQHAPTTVSTPRLQAMEQHVSDPPTHRRPVHEHAEYGDGQYEQQVVPTHDDGCGDGCLHRVINWNGQPWPKLHAIGLQIHDWNRRDIYTDPQIQSMESTVFGQDGIYTQSNLSKTLKIVHARKQVTWYRMDCKKSGYRGFQGICNICGAVMWCAWSPRSTRGWRDHQKANLLAFLGLQIPPSLMRPLEPTLPMV